MKKLEQQIIITLTDLDQLTKTKVMKQTKQVLLACIYKCTLYLLRMTIMISVTDGD